MCRGEGIKLLGDGLWTFPGRLPRASRVLNLVCRDAETSGVHRIVRMLR